jgi:hypothetical protein
MPVEISNPWKAFLSEEFTYAPFRGWTTDVSVLENIGITTPEGTNINIVDILATARGGANAPALLVLEIADFMQKASDELSPGMFKGLSVSNTVQPSLQDMMLDFIFIPGLNDDFFNYAFESYYRAGEHTLEYGSPGWRKAQGLPPAPDVDLTWAGLGYGPITKTGDVLDPLYDNILKFPLHPEKWGLFVRGVEMELRTIVGDRKYRRRLPTAIEPLWGRRKKVKRFDPKPPKEPRRFRLKLRKGRRKKTIQLRGRRGIGVELIRRYFPRLYDTIGFELDKPKKKEKKKKVRRDKWGMRISG